MRLLVVSQWFPYPPVNGAKTRVYNLLKRLAQKHELHLLTFYQEDEDLDHLYKVREFCREVRTVKAREFKPSALSTAAGLLSLRPRSSVECYSEEMASLVRSTVESTNFDAALALTLRAAEYIADIPIIPKVLDEDNAESAFMRRNMEQQNGWACKFRHKMTWVKARIHERKIASRFDAVTAVSDDDRDEIARVVPELAEKEAIYVVPNGVDLELLDYRPSAKDRNRLVYTGALSYFANLDAVRYFCLDVLPLIKREIPEIRLQVTGSTRGVDISELTAISGVEFTGFVPDIKPVVAEAAALVVSARLGGGTRLKVLEAMALGTPVVATTLGGMGFGAVSGKHMLIADDPREFAEAVLSVIRDDELSARLTANGREFVREHYGWDAIAGKLEEVIRISVERKEGTRCNRTATTQPTG